LIIANPKEFTDFFFERDGSTPGVTPEISIFAISNLYTPSTQIQLLDFDQIIPDRGIARFVFQMYYPTFDNIFSFHYFLPHTLSIFNFPPPFA
jgi:hypothetical protein